MPPPDHPVPLRTVLRSWGRIGCLGFGGPPVHVAMLRELCVEREGWIEDDAFEDAIAATNLLPGPGSSQLAILTAWTVRGRLGGLVGGLAFVGPGLVAMLVLAAVFLASSPPEVVRGAGAGAGAVVAAVAVHAGWGLLQPSWARARGSRPMRWAAYAVLGATAAVLLGPWLVLVLLGCGVAELAWTRSGGARRRPRGSGGRGGSADGGSASRRGLHAHAWPVLLAAASGVGGLGALAWTALKVGALSYGGGFVIIPLMQADAVDRHHWLTDARFLDAVALGQVTPGPVVHTVAAVGYAAHGVGGALLAAAVAFAPSFAVVLVLAPRFERLRADARLRAFLDGAGPAALGAILGAAVPLAASVTETWQVVVLVVGGALLLAGRLSVVWTLLAAGAAGAVLVAALGAPVAG
ncbi:chromate efflux transporter [Patulibacter minatonensis]|uniref:chromate efflux transporter n=1 Tax=Patulibacter minatonensis TaxID=298163 RepID=UPI00047EF5F7|nr:chromate efflux transporter [Patulibacter minatonensis]